MNLPHPPASRATDPTRSFPPHWRHDSHAQSYRAARQGARRRAAVASRDRVIVRLLRGGLSQREAASLMTRLANPEACRDLGELRALKAVREALGITVTWAGEVTRRIVQGAADRLRRGLGVSRCEDRACGRDGGPCDGRRWRPFPEWSRVDPVSRLRELSRWRPGRSPGVEPEPTAPRTTGQNMEGRGSDSERESERPAPPYRPMGRGKTAQVPRDHGPYERVIRRS